MSSSQEKFVFPSKRPIRKMRDLIEAGEIQDLQVTTAKGSVLADLPIHTSPEKIVPKIFRIPAQTVGIGISTVARILGLRVIFRTAPDVFKDGGE